MEKEKKYKCKVEGCEAAFLRPSRLLWHTRQHNGEKPYKCSFENCDKAYSNSTHLKRHMDSHNKVKLSFKCPQCPKTLINRHSLNLHMKRIHSNENMICKECGKRFRKKELFEQHIAFHEKSSVVQNCNDCNLKFTCPRKFKQHLLMHKNTLLKCLSCKVRFDEREEYYNHLKNEHPTDHVCSKCKQFFLRPHYLKKHRCEYDKICPCPYKDCDRFYYHKRNLDTHIKVSHLGKTFTCDICKSEFKSKKTVGHHIFIKHMNTVPRLKKFTVRNRRKDAGIPKKSTISALLGVDFNLEVQKILLNPL